MANEKTARTVERSKVTSDLVRSDSGDRSYSDCVFAHSQAAAHTLGQVMKETAGKLVPITAAADTVAAILTYNVDATGTTDVEGFVLDTDAEIASAEIVYFDGATAADKTTIKTKLAALGIKVRQSA